MIAFWTGFIYMALKQIYNDYKNNKKNIKQIYNDTKRP